MRTRAAIVMIWGMLLLGAAACSDGEGPAGADASIDAPVDAPLDTPSAAVCPPCAPDEICLQIFDGVCGGGVPHCVTRTVDCPQNACSEDCEDAYCSGGFQCEIRSPCGTEAPGAFTCYGP